MPKIVCPECNGRRYDVEITCPDCSGSGYDPNEDNPFAQCHTCSGNGKVNADVCPKCDGRGKIEIEYENTSTPELSQTGFYKCSDCGALATHVLVDYHHSLL